MSGVVARHCISCRWGVPIDEDEYTELPDKYDLVCRRRCPQVITVNGDMQQCEWPLVSGLDWCGEYEE